MLPVLLHAAVKGMLVNESASEQEPELLCAMQRFIADLKGSGSIESQPALQGKTMYMVVAPPK